MSHDIPPKERRRELSHQIADTLNETGCTPVRTIAQMVTTTALQRAKWAEQKDE